MIVRRAAPFAAALTAGLALGWAATAHSEPIPRGAPATVYVTTTVKVPARYHGHSAAFLALRLRQARRSLARGVLRQRSLTASLKKQTFANREAARDYADDYGIRSSAFLCIHRYEGSWTAATGNGYYGGVQMDRSFMSTYGGPFLRAYGTADHWPAYLQIAVAEYARLSGRGYAPWPNTARACGLIR